MMYVQLVLTFARSKVGRYLIAALFGAITLTGVYFAIKRKIENDLQRNAVIEERSRVNEAIRRGDSVPSDPERMRKSSDGRWCRDC